MAFYQAYEGLSWKFLDNSNTAGMNRVIRRGFTAIGVLGHLARTVVFGLVGYGLIKAAIDYNPHSAIGLDELSNSLAHSSYGPLLLGVVATGLIAFALYSIADAGYRKL